MTEQRNPWPSAEAAIATILRRDTFANQRLHYAVRTAFMLACLAVFAAGCALTLVTREQPYRYILTKDTGELLPMVPLEQANHDDEFIARWTVDTVTRLYSFDFVNYRQQLQEARRNLTTFGWTGFEKAMEVSGNFRAILDNRYAVTAVPTGPAVVIKSAIHTGFMRHAWRVEFPLLLTYQSSQMGADGRPLTANQNLKVSVVVIRQPEYLQREGLGIRSILAE